jgi:hypothetical protein
MKCTVTEEQRKSLEKINRQIMRKSWWYRTKRKFLLPFVKLMPAQDIVWTVGYGGSYPACPRCGEYVYYADLCCFCGQRLRNAQTVGSVMEKHER